MQKLLLFIFLICSALSSQAQDRSLLVVDKTTGEPVPFANVCFEDIESGKQDYTTTNQKGIVVLPNSGNVELSISFIGYISYKDKVDLSKITKVELEADIFALDQVVVTGQGKPMVRDSSIYEIAVFDSKLIQQRGAVNLADVLRAQPSIKIAQSGATGANINILGLGGENVKIMIDGVPIIGRVDGNIDLNQITMENVDHIEVIEGPMSVIYGSNALAGTVNIITKNNKWNKFSLNASTYAESPGTFNADILGSGRFGSNVITASLSRNYFDGVSYDDSRQSKWRGSTQYNSELSYARYGDRYTFRMNGKYFQEDMLDKGKIESNNNAFDTNYLTNRYSANAFLDFEHNSSMQTNVQASVSYYDRLLHSIKKDMTNLEEYILAGDTTSFTNYMARATFNHAISDVVSYQTGIDANHEIGTAERIQGGKQDIGDYALFITSKHEFWKGVMIQPGLRYAYNTKFDSPLLYSLNVKADISENWQTRASFAKGFRAPTLKDMFLDFAHAGINVVGNPDLGPESSYTLNGSLSYKRRDTDESMFRMEAKGYYNSISDMIVFTRVEDVEGTETWSNINRDHINTFGWVLDTKYDIGQYWSFNANFTRGAISSIQYLEMGTGDEYFYSNNFLASALLKLPNYNFTTRLEYAYNGAEASRYVDEVTELEPYSEAYNDINFTLTKSFFNGNLNLSAGVKNILNNQDLKLIGAEPGSGSAPDTSDPYRLLSWGRSYFIKINYKLNSN